MPNAAFEPSTFGIRLDAAWLTAGLLILTIIYAVLQVGFVRPYLSADTRPNLARPPALARRRRRRRSTAWRDGAARRPGHTPTWRTDHARLGARAPRHGGPGDRVHGRGARAARAAQQRPHRAALGAGARPERRGRRRPAARRRAGLSLRRLEGADGLHVARRARWRFRSSRSRSSTSRRRRRCSRAPVAARRAVRRGGADAGARDRRRRCISSASTRCATSALWDAAHPGAYYGSFALALAINVAGARRRRLPLQVQPRRERAAPHPDGGLHGRARRVRLRAEGRRPDRRRC